MSPMKNFRLNISLNIIETNPIIFLDEDLDSDADPLD